MITLRTIVQFLAFREAAHRSVMQSRDIRWLGVLLVLSAGFAREYDGEYLLADWWYLVIPLAASLVGSFALTLVVWITAWFRGVRSIGLITTFGAILNAYWMTAPLAWLYAIPVERFLGEVDAVRANLALLGLVSIWRVALMIRSLSILYACRYWEALMPIMVFSLILGYVAIQMLPVPLFVVMGGVRIPESEQIIVDTRLQITLCAVLSAPAWIIGFIINWFIKKRWVWSLESHSEQIPHRVSPSAYAVGIVSLLVWLPVLPWTQAEQFQRWYIEDIFKRGDYREVAEWSRQVKVEDLPPHWIPPPRLVYGYANVKTIDQSVAILNEDLSDWYAEQCREVLRENLTGRFDSTALEKLELLTLKGLVSLKDQGKIDEEFVDRLADMAKRSLDDPASKLLEETHQLLEAMRSWKRSDETP
ncbi:MAG: hypothetical protein ACK5PB_22450 [Pirellula sp.]|jgi:hypothetical protein